MLGGSAPCAGKGRADHASYIASCLDVLKNDKRAIFTAAAHAQRAADYLHGLQQTVDGMGGRRLGGPLPSRAARAPRRARSSASQLQVCTPAYVQA